MYFVLQVPTGCGWVTSGTPGLSVPQYKNTLCSLSLTEEQLCSWVLHAAACMHAQMKSHLTKGVTSHYLCHEWNANSFCLCCIAVDRIACVPLCTIFDVCSWLCIARLHMQWCWAAVVVLFVVVYAQQSQATLTWMCYTLKHIVTHLFVFHLKCFQSHCYRHIKSSTQACSLLLQTFMREWAVLKSSPLYAPHSPHLSFSALNKLSLFI